MIGRLTQPAPSLQFRPVQPADRPGVQHLLDTSHRAHVHPDWRPPADWIGQAPGMVATDRHGVAAALVTPADPAPAAWIRLAAVRDSFFWSPARVTRRLLDGCLSLLADQQTETLAAMPLDPWLAPILDDLGFSIVEQVETWGKTDLVATRSGDQSLAIRPVLPGDLETLTALDALAFAPRWRYSAASLEVAHQKAGSFLLAERAGEILGFAISVYDNQHAHLARLTVRPDVQRQGVGTRLLAAALADYAGAGQVQVTLNTQVDNHASHFLYTAFGFHRISHPLAVWERPV